MSEYPYSPAFFQRPLNALVNVVPVLAAPHVAGVRISALIGVKRHYRAHNQSRTLTGSVAYDGGKSRVELYVFAPDGVTQLHMCSLDIPERDSLLIAPHSDWIGTQIVEHKLALRNDANAFLEGVVMPGFPDGVKFAPMTPTRVDQTQFATPMPSPDYAQSVLLPGRFRAEFKEPRITGDVRVMDTETEIWATVQVELMEGK